MVAVRRGSEWGAVGHAAGLTPRSSPWLSPVTRENGGGVAGQSERRGDREGAAGDGSAAEQGEVVLREGFHGQAIGDGRVA